MDLALPYFIKEEYNRDNQHIAYTNNVKVDISIASLVLGLQYC